VSDRDRRWVIASSNAGKVAELEALLACEGFAAIELCTQTELGIAGAPETAPTFVENALLKARHASRLSGLPALADDSGLTVEALDGAPGVRSARFAGTDADDDANVAKLLAALETSQATDRSAAFHCVIVLIQKPADPAPLIATGRWDGEIAPRPSGNGGFGYDPVFFDRALGRTAAELPAALKNRVSHRARALTALLATLRAARGPS
jgi:XTP/dITP diphosphohydrolase